VNRLDDAANEIIRLIRGLHFDRPARIAAIILTIVGGEDKSQTTTIGLAKGSLEDARIPFWMQDDETAARLVLGPIMFPSCRFLVPKDREAEARELLDSLESAQQGKPLGKGLGDTVNVVLEERIKVR
jgi:hypothetical protein